MSDNDISIRGTTWDHIRGWGPLEASVTLYKEEAGIQISWSKRNLKDFGDASLDKLAQEYDLIIMDHPHVGTASVTRCIIPMDEIISEEILEEALLNSVGPSFGSYRYDNHVWALPIDAACQVSCYREDLLNKLPLPETWDDVFSLSDHLKTKDKYVGMALCQTDCACCFLTLCAQAGDPFEEHKLPSFSTVEYALTLLQKLAAYCHSESTRWNPIGLYDHMQTDDIAYCPLSFGYTNYARVGYGKKQLRYGTIPGKKHAILGGAGIAVSKFSVNIPHAAAYAAWLCGENFQSTIYVEAGGQSAHKKAWKNKEADKIAGHFFSDTLSTIEEAYVRPRTHHWPLFQEELGAIIHSCITKNMNPEKTWKEIVGSYKYFLMRLFR
jgi:multiple sugar transport system substrate-binding protein